MLIHFMCNILEKTFFFKWSYFIFKYFSTHDIGNIQFTSGTTGMPKAAAISHYNMVNNVIASTIHQSSIIDHISPEMVLCNVLPLYHVFSFTGRDRHYQSGSYKDFRILFQSNFDFPNADTCSQVDLWLVHMLELQIFSQVLVLTRNLYSRYLRILKKMMLMKFG